MTGTGQAYEYDPPREKRRPGDATREAGEGDDAWHRGNMDVALSSYLNAWQADPQSELALKIGELYLQKGMSPEARAWWTRYRKDAPNAKAQLYIDQMLEP